MTEEQLAQLMSAPAEEDEGPFKIYRPAFSRMSGDRTLLYGYTCDRDTFHVYLKDDLVHLAVYRYDDVTVAARTEFASFDELAPNKRVYSEASDFEFCKFLKEQGVHMTFLRPDPRREPAQFYGRLAD